MRAALGVAAALGPLAAPVAAAAQDRSPQVLARAIAGPPDAEVVQWVARHAEPLTYDAKARPDLATATVRQIIERQCGSVQSGYAGEVARLNGWTSLDLDAVLGEAAYAARWPACLYATAASATPVVRYTIKPDDTLTSIRQRFTGAGAFDRAALSSFFAGSNLSISQARTLPTGAAVMIPNTTAATLLTPKTSSAAFSAELDRVAQGSVAAIPDPTPPGDVIGPVRFSAGDTGSVQGTFQDCAPGAAGEAYPFDPAEVLDAYGKTRDAISTSVSRVSLVIVDNGFFGVPCDPNDCPVMEGEHPRGTAAFPRIYFDPDEYPASSGFGPTLSGSKIQPLNYWNPGPNGQPFAASDINEDSGHGTHVAGLALGGPDFESHRGAFLGANGKPWLRLVVANVANGRRQLLPGADRNLTQLLAPVSGMKIVNMSIAFNGLSDTSMAGTIRAAIVNDPSMLVVAAAGNEGANLAQDEREYYPARFGGGQARNVVTVASVDGRVDGVAALSEFSNRSAKYVDIAAPGCKLKSWLDGRSPAPVSGTSQAAPVVAFTAALLQSMWQTSPALLRNRLLYSGDLLDRDVDRSAVLSESRLNPAKALTFQWDRITYVRDGASRTLLGKASLVQGVSCDETGPVLPQNLRAFKRDAAGRVVVYRLASDQTLSVCRGKTGTASPTFTPEFEVVAGRIGPLQAPMGPSPNIAEIQELVRAR